jgi:hypothetical protein
MGMENSGAGKDARKLAGKACNYKRGRITG